MPQDRTNLFRGLLTDFLDATGRAMQAGAQAPRGRSATAALASGFAFPRVLREEQALRDQQSLENALRQAQIGLQAQTTANTLNESAIDRAQGGTTESLTGTTARSLLPPELQARMPEQQAPVFDLNTALELQTAEANRRAFERTQSGKDLRSELGIRAELASPEGFTLSEDAVRFDAEGNVVARNPGDVDLPAAIDGTIATVGQKAWDSANQDQRLEMLSAYTQATTNPANIRIGDEAPDISVRTMTASADIIASTGELLNLVGDNTVGLTGTVLQFIPETEAADFAAKLDPLMANIAFMELQAMRDASQTGGALGQVSEMELRLLRSVRGSLAITQSPEAFRNELLKIQRSTIRRISILSAEDPEAAARAMLDEVIREVESLTALSPGFEPVGGQ